MKRWFAQVGGAALLTVMVAAAAVEGASLHQSRATKPAVTYAPPVAIVHHSCAQADGIGDNTGLVQANDGRLSACLRVGSVAPGAYNVVARRFSAKHPSSSTSTPPGDWLSLAPSSGPPGTSVTVTGYVAGTNAEERRDDHATVCWSECDGLTGTAEISWSSMKPGQFTARFTTPAAPWYGPNGVEPLKPGSYKVIFPCMPDFIDKPGGGCNFAKLEATFNLIGPAARECTGAAACAVVEVAPMQGTPGTLVAVDGWAPLTGLNGFGFLTAAIEGQQPTGKPGADAFTPIVASTPFSVSAARDWTALSRMQPMAVQRTGLDAIGVDPANQNRFAYCADGAIEITVNGGASWSAISVAGVAAASAATNYPIPGPYVGATRPACSSVWLDAKYPGTIYAAFIAVGRNSSPPPFNRVAYVTTNDGGTWQPVPVPATSEMGLFGGFRVDRASAQAVFWTSPQATTAASTSGFVVEETLDGARTWHSASLRCPASEPCVNLGPQDDSRCQAVGEWQAIETSGDSGRSWSSPGWPSRLSACTLSELVGLTGGGVAAIDEFSQYPLTLSTDGGLTWQAIALPVPPDNAGNFANCCGWALQILPDGRLLLTGSSWYLLAPAGSQWCAVSGTPQPTYTFGSPAPLVIGNRLWWVDSNQNGPGDFRSTARSAPIAAIHC